MGCGNSLSNLDQIGSVDHTLMTEMEEDDMPNMANVRGC